MVAATMVRRKWLSCLYNFPSPRKNPLAYLTLIGVIWFIFIMRQLPSGPMNEELHPGDPRWMAADSTRKIRMIDLIPIVDKHKVDFAKELMDSIPNLPTHYANKTSWKLGKNNCAKYPKFYDLHFNNLYWQVLHSSNGSFYILNAFLDNRTRTPSYPVIRLLGMIDRVQPSVETHCQIWYKGEVDPVVSKVTQYRYIWIRQWGNYHHGQMQPHLIQCGIPEERKHLVPYSVSLVETPCEMPTNNLRIINNLPENGRQEDFAVCVKGLSFPHNDNTVRLVEWLELLFLLGANKVFMYDLDVHPNVAKMLDYYQAQGKVEVTKLTLPGELPNGHELVHMFVKAKLVHKRQNEVIPYNDCLYKNMNLYKFVVLLDTDEIIVPRAKLLNWKNLMEKVAPEAMLGTEGTGKVSYCALNTYFLDDMQTPHGYADDIPGFMHMAQHIWRAKNNTKPGNYVKCFHDTQGVHVLHNHFPFGCLGACSSKHFDPEDALLQHYRSDCVGEQRRSCIYYRNHTIVDDSILRFKAPLINNTLHTLRHLGLLKD